jgi:hypothetical protein
VTSEEILRLLERVHVCRRPADGAGAKEINHRDSRFDAGRDPSRGIALCGSDAGPDRSLLSEAPHKI